MFFAAQKFRIFVVAVKKGQALPEFPETTHCTWWNQNEHFLTLNNIGVSVIHLFKSKV
jgi:hypothetical protein